jgi:hypothetical protein
MKYSTGPRGGGTYAGGSGCISVLFIAAILADGAYVIIRSIA